MTEQNGTHTWPEVLGTIFSGISLDRGQAAWAMERIMTGEATPSQLGAFLAGLRVKGESVEEMVGLVETMRGFGQKVEVDYPVVDTCGTGGDRSGSVNVSTMAALIVAGAGGKVAKHGNRAMSSSCGSADVLEALGVKVDLGPDGVRRCLDEAGIGFCFAPVFHPSMRHAGPIRKELGVPTVFNFLGPLTNPAGARYQALGVSNKAMAPKMLEVLTALGSTRVLIFRGFDGLDEISTTGPSDLWELEDGRLKESVVDPLDLGIPRAAPSALAGGTAEHNARVVREVLDGRQGPDRDVALVNAAAGIVAAGLSPDLAEGLEKARESVDSGAARKALDRLTEVSTG
ncbi:MAG TPA: anthranilate phosphoribosyltransferase [Actinomycetota bacterium]|nr:anthranilate phosphoribosyltransferase [Actinomycetota bacterium]